MKLTIYSCDPHDRHVAFINDETLVHPTEACRPGWGCLPCVASWSNGPKEDGEPIEEPVAEPVAIPVGEPVDEPVFCSDNCIENLRQIAANLKWEVVDIRLTGQEFEDRFA